MKWYSDIWNPKSLIVIYLDFSQNECAISAGKITKDSNPAEIQSFGSVVEAVEYFGKSKAYHLHLLGSGILSRKVESSKRFRQDLIMNGDVNDFLFTSFDDDQSTVVSFCRRSLLDEFLEQFQEEKWHLYGVSCGPTPIYNVLEDEKVTFDFELEMKDDQISQFQRSEEPSGKSLWRSDQWSRNALIGHAIYSSIRKENDQYEVTGDSSQVSRRANYHQFSRFKTFGIGVIGTIFLALVVNYFYQNHLNDRVAQLETDLSVHNVNLSTLDQLTQEKARKEKLVVSAGVNATNFLSFYLDHIAETVPKSIKLSEMTVFPVNGKMKNKQKVEIDQERIVISGFTNGNEELDDWMELMDRFDWIKSVQLLNYLKSTEKWAEFELELRLLK